MKFLFTIFTTLILTVVLFNIPPSSTWCPVHHQYAKFVRTDKSANTCANVYRDYYWSGSYPNREFNKHEFTIPCDSKGY